MRTVPGEGGETGALLRARDWSVSPLGPMDGWPEPLKTLVSVMLGSAQPMYLVWGSERVLLYNDAYAVLCGARHPDAFGKPFAQVWPDALPTVGPMLDRAFDGRSHHQDDLTLVLTRNGDAEEAHFSFSFTPVRAAEGAVQGVLCVCQETTRIVEGARRDAFRADLGDRLRALSTPQDVMREMAAELARHLGADQVGYSDIDAESGRVLVLEEWRADGMPSVLGEHRLDAYGWVGRELEAGRTTVIADSAADDREPSIRDVLQVMGIGGSVCAPVLRDGRLSGVLFVHSAAPRRWRPDEISLIEEVAVRTWSAVDRRRAEAALREREARLRLVQEAGGIGHFDADLVTGRIHRSPEYLAIQGMPPGTPLEGAFDDGWEGRLHPDDRERVKAWFTKDVARGGAYERRYRIVRPSDGAVRHVLNRGRIELDDARRPVRLLSAQTDVTDEVEAEEAVRTAREELLLLTDALPVLISYIDGEERYRFNNRAYEDWFGRSRDALYGRTVREVLGEAAYAAVKPAIDRVLAGERFSFDAHMPYKDAGTRDVRVEYVPRRAADGAVEGWYALVSDVSDQVRAERALRESEARFRSLADAMPQLVWIASADGRVEYYNARASEYAGLSQDGDGAWRWEPMVHPDDLAETARLWRAAYESGAPYSAEHRLQRADGSWSWHVSRAVAARDAEGRVARWYGTATDVHALKATEAALRESEARFRNMADHAPVMMWVTDETGFCTYLNEAWYEFTGQEPHEAEGLGWLEATHPDDKALAGETFLNANAARAPFRVEYRLRRRDGTHRWCLDAASPRFGPEGDFLGYVGSVIDIDERRETETRLRDGEARLRTLTNVMPAFVWFATPDGSLQYFNERWFEYTGQTADEALPDGWAATLHPDDAERTAREWEAARRAGSTYEIEVRYRRRDGAYRWYVARAEPVRDGDGAVAGWFGTSSDIHDRKTAEAELQRLNETLEQRVMERTRELIAAEEALRQAQKLEAIGQLTGGVAHDFNNLLTVIRSSADLLRRRELPEERRRKYVDAISDTADRAAKLTGQLLAFARRQALKFEVFDAGAQVQGIADMLRTVLGARVELSIEVDDGCWVEADLAQFETALVNMAVNARDAMNGEGRLHVRVAPAPDAGDGDGFVSVTVTDTGPGVPEAVLSRIFEPFFTTKDLGKGTGLGLSQVYGFAKQSGGEITVRNVPDAGAAFALQLPRASAARAAPAAARSRPGDTASGHGRVLVVEDNAQVGEFATQLLADLGYLTTHEPDAQAALQRLDRERDAFDLVFSDVVMPGMSGVEFGRRVRERWPDLPVVLTSGYSNVLAEDARHGFPLLQKPYSVEELSRTLRRAQRQG